MKHRENGWILPNKYMKHMAKIDEHGGLSHRTICKISVEYGEHGGYNWI